MLVVLRHRAHFVSLNVSHLCFSGTRKSDSVYQIRHFDVNSNNRDGE